MGAGWKRAGVAVMAVIGVVLLVLSPHAPMLEKRMEGVSLEVMEVDIPSYEYYYDSYQLYQPPPDQNPARLSIRDVEGTAAFGRIVALNFTASVYPDSRPFVASHINIDVIDGVHQQISYVFPSVVTGVLADPQLHYSRNQMNENTRLRVSLGGLDIDPGSELKLRFRSFYDSYDHYQTLIDLVVPRFLTEPPLFSGRDGCVLVRDTDGSYPGPSERDWLVDNRTVIEGLDRSFENRIIVTRNGTLELRDSRLHFYDRAGAGPGIFVAEGGRLHAVNCTFALVGMAAGSDIRARGYDFMVFGEMTMERSAIAGNPRGIRLFSDNVTMEDCDIFDPVECRFCSPELYRCRLYIQSLNGEYGEHAPCARLVGSSPRVTGCLFDGKGANNDRALDLSGNCSARIHGNTFVNFSTGLHCRYYASPNVTENRFELSGTGLYCELRAAPAVTGNAFLGPGTGITLRGASGFVIGGNSFDCHNHNAVSLYQCSTGVIRDNLITNGSISVNGDSFPEILGNRITSQQEAILITHANATVSQNVISFWGTVVKCYAGTARLSGNTFLSHEPPYWAHSGGMIGPYILVQIWELRIEIHDENDHELEDNEPIRTTVRDSTGERVASGGSYIFQTVLEKTVDLNGTRTNRTPHRVQVRYRDQTIQFNVTADRDRRYHVEVSRTTSSPMPLLYFLLPLGVAVLVSAGVLYLSLRTDARSDSKIAVAMPAAAYPFPRPPSEDGPGPPPPDDARVPPPEKPGRS